MKDAQPDGFNPAEAEEGFKRGICVEETHSEYPDVSIQPKPKKGLKE